MIILLISWLVLTNKQHSLVFNTSNTKNVKIFLPKLEAKVEKVFYYKTKRVDVQFSQ